LRYRIIDFLPLILALALVAAWFGFRQPLPWSLPLPAAASPAAPSSSPAAPPAQPTASAPALSRAAVIQSLCDAGQPSFLGSLGSLKERLGARMGDPRVCERQIDSDGNTEQMTTTGLAYYRRGMNAAIFTTGYEHWALVGNKLLYWTGDAVDPPPDARPAD
jgi:hypothetical protein